MMILLLFLFSPPGALPLTAADFNLDVMPQITSIAKQHFSDLYLQSAPIYA